jgi:hypothetical protein
MNSTNHSEGLNLRQAALIAGFGYLLMPAAFAEFHVFPKLVIPGSMEQTVQNIVVHGRLFFVGILCHLVTLILDVVIAWALYVLLVPVNRSLSLLTAWFRLVYTVLALFGLLNLVTVFRLLHTPAYLTDFGSQQLHAQVKLLLNSFRYDSSISLVIFGIHLGLLGYLTYRSRYIPKILGILLVFVGFSWVIYSLRPYLYPNANLGFIPITGFGELIFPLWLVVRGWKIQEQPARQ